MNLEIRRASDADAPTVALLGRITFAETFGYLFTKHSGDLRDYLDCTFNVAKIRNSIAEAGNWYWLSFLDGLPVGYAKLKYPSPAPQLPKDDPAQLQKIYVLREYVGAGIGKPLFEVALKETAQIGVHTLILYVLKENARAVHFYEKQGMKVAGEATHAIGAQTFHFHLMALRGVSARH